MKIKLSPNPHRYNEALFHNIYAKPIQPTDPLTEEPHGLDMNTLYPVTAIEMSSFYTSIELAISQTRRYNSCIFEFYENGELLDIYEDKRFNDFK